MRVQLSTAGLGLLILPSVTAFYPYSPQYGGDSHETARRGQPGPRQPALEDRRAITLPIRRVPTRRDNIYDILESDDPKQENSVAIDQDQDLSYMVAVTIGDSTEEYHLLLDSAASSTWIMGQDCPSEACKTHSLIGKGDSSSLKTEATKFSITYGTGTVSGTLASDTLHIGPLSPTVSFGIATNVSDEFRAYPMDGILGIGRGTKVDGRIEAPQVMDVLKSSKLVGSKLYGIHLSRAKTGLNDGELNMGAPNTDRYDGGLNYVPVVANNNGFWEVKVGDVGVDSVALGIGGTTAIVDTGTSFIFMPEGDATSIHDLVEGSQKSGETYTVPCGTTKVIWMEFGGQKYNISIADWVGGDVGSGNCRSNIVGRQTFGEHQWLVGDVFLKNVYTVLDFDNSQVGFGVKGGNKEEKPTSVTVTATSTTGPSAGPSASALDKTSPLVTSPSVTETQTSPSSAKTEAQETGASPAPTGGSDLAAALSASCLLVSCLLGLGAFFA